MGQDLINVDADAPQEGGDYRRRGDGGKRRAGRAKRAIGKCAGIDLLGVGNHQTPGRHALDGNDAAAAPLGRADLGDEIGATGKVCGCQAQAAVKTWHTENAPCVGAAAIAFQHEPVVLDGGRFLLCFDKDELEMVKAQQAETCVLDGNELNSDVRHEDVLPVTGLELLRDQRSRFSRLWEMGGGGSASRSSRRARAQLLR